MNLLISGTRRDSSFLRSRYARIGVLSSPRGVLARKAPPHRQERHQRPVQGRPAGDALVVGLVVGDYVVADGRLEAWVGRHGVEGDHPSLAGAGNRHPVVVDLYDVVDDRSCIVHLRSEGVAPPLAAAPAVAHGVESHNVEPLAVQLVHELQVEERVHGGPRDEDHHGILRARFEMVEPQVPARQRQHLFPPGAPEVLHADIAHEGAAVGFEHLV